MIDASIPPTAAPQAPGTPHGLKAAKLLGGVYRWWHLTYGEAHGTLQEGVERNTDDLSRSMQTIEEDLRHGRSACQSLLMSLKLHASTGSKPTAAP